MNAAAIDALLPQTQCTRCGYAGCLPYAEAIAAGDADINQCPPGRDETIQALASLLGREALPLNPAHGAMQPGRVAWIDEARCIGCAKCLPPCPVDAIVGASRYLHTIVAEACTGCELCIAPCPVDCIVLIPRTDGDAPLPADNRARFAARNDRLARLAVERAAQIEAAKRAARHDAGA